MRAEGKELAFMVAVAIVSVPALLALWLGPAAYGGWRLATGDTVLGAVVLAAGLTWALLHVRDKVLPGLLVGTIASLLVVAGIIEDPWDEDPGDDPPQQDR